MRIARLLSFLLQACLLPLHGQVDAEIDRILGWLPEDTETVLVSRSPFVVVDYDDDEAVIEERIADGSITEMDLIAVVPRSAFILGIAGAALGDTSGQVWRGRRIRLALIAARHFHRHNDSPSPLGFISYQGCGVYSFGEPLPPLPSDGTHIEVEGLPVRVSFGMQFAPVVGSTLGPIEHLTVQLNSEFILVCNDRDFLQTVLERRARTAAGRALPGTLPEWKYLDRSAAVWGLSHFGEGHIGPREIGDSQAIGITVQYGPRTEGVRARWLSGSAANPWPPEEGFTASNADPGVWDLRGPYTEETVDMATFGFMALLGFGVVF